MATTFYTPILASDLGLPIKSPPDMPEELKIAFSDWSLLSDWQLFCACVRHSTIAQPCPFLRLLCHALISCLSGVQEKRQSPLLPSSCLGHVSQQGLILNPHLFYLTKPNQRIPLWLVFPKVYSKNHKSLQNYMVAKLCAKRSCLVRQDWISLWWSPLKKCSGYLYLRGFEKACTKIHDECLHFKGSKKCCSQNKSVLPFK